MSSTWYQLTQQPGWTAAGRFNYLILQLIPATSPTSVCGTDGQEESIYSKCGDVDVWRRINTVHTHHLEERTYATCNTT